ERAHRVEIVVENRNLHALRSANRWRRSRAYWARELTQSRSRIEPRSPRRRSSCAAESRAIERFELRGPSCGRRRCWNRAKSFLFNCLPRRILTVRTRRRGVERQQRAVHGQAEIRTHEAALQRGDDRSRRPRQDDVDGGADEGVGGEGLDVDV